MVNGIGFSIATSWFKVSTQIVFLLTVQLFLLMAFPELFQWQKIAESIHELDFAANNIAVVEVLVLSQEENPGTHRSVLEIARETGIKQITVHRIIHKELQLKCLKKKRAQELMDANKLSRLVRAKQLLCEYPLHQVQFIWFTYEKLFTVSAPKNAQNDRLYAPVGTKKKQVLAARQLCTRSTFS